MIMSSMVSGFLTALPVVLVGVAVLLLALDARINRFIRADHAKRLALHDELLHEWQHGEQVRASYEQAAPEQSAFGSSTSAARG